MRLLSRRASSLSLGTLFVLASCGGGGNGSGSIPATQVTSVQPVPLANKCSQQLVNSTQTNSAARHCGTQTFAYTGGSQTFTVPNGVKQIFVTAVGASGGDVTFPPFQAGLGEAVVATLPVMSKQSLDVEVGGAGDSGGYNGGGAGSGNGGGASDIRTTRGNLATRILVAGGGGGNSFTGETPAIGGNAGFSRGSDGAMVGVFPSGAHGGSGGGQTCCAAGGTGGGNTGLGSGGGDGALGIGGAGGKGLTVADGGGGGGYYGGGGGGFFQNRNIFLIEGIDAGGGGSSFVEASATGVSSSQATVAQCDTSNDGCITISW